MPSPESVVITCDNKNKILASMIAVMPQLEPDVRRRFIRIVGDFSQRYGEEEAFNRANNRTVSQLLAEYETKIEKPIASGEIDDVRYELYDAPASNTKADNPSPEG